MVLLLLVAIIGGGLYSMRTIHVDSQDVCPVYRGYSL
jgi:hypothetical protein